MGRFLVFAVLAVAVAAKRPIDPWNIFCGPILCYDVLEVAQDAPMIDIKKSYRRLAIKWHPDKNPDNVDGAKKEFEKVAKAYEVVGTEGARKKYDHLLANPKEYYKQYGEFFYKVIAPKSDIRLVIVGAFLFISLLHFAYLYNRHISYKNLLVRVVAEDKKGQQSSDQIQDWHKQAKEMFLKLPPEEKKEEKPAEAKTNGSKEGARPKSTNSGSKAPAVKKKDAYKTDPRFLECIEQVVGDNFPDPGYHKPTFADSLIAKLPKLPSTIASEASYYMALSKSEHTEAERDMLTQRAVGKEIWDDLDDENRAALRDPAELAKYVKLLTGASSGAEKKDKKKRR